jgi:hypothetical protein
MAAVPTCSIRESAAQSFPSVRRTWESDRAVQRTRGETRRLVHQSLDGETSLGSSESTRAARNYVNFRNASQTRCRQVTGSRNCGIDTVSVGRDQMTKPRCGAAREGHRKFISECYL